MGVNQMEYLYNFVVHDTTLRPSPFEDMCILDQIEHFNQELPNPRENELKPTQKPKMDNILLNKKNSEILVSDSGSTPERSGIIRTGTTTTTQNTMGNEKIKEGDNDFLSGGNGNENEGEILESTIDGLFEMHTGDINAAVGSTENDVDFSEIPEVEVLLTENIDQENNDG